MERRFDDTFQLSKLYFQNNILVVPRFFLAKNIPEGEFVRLGKSLNLASYKYFKHFEDFQNNL